MARAIAFAFGGCRLRDGRARWRCGAFRHALRAYGRQWWTRGGNLRRRARAARRWHRRPRGGHRRAWRGSFFGPWMGRTSRGDASRNDGSGARSKWHRVTSSARRDARSRTCGRRPAFRVGARCDIRRWLLCDDARHRRGTRPHHRVRCRRRAIEHDARHYLGARSGDERRGRGGAHRGLRQRRAHVVRVRSPRFGRVARRDDACRSDGGIRPGPRIRRCDARSRRSRRAAGKPRARRTRRQIRRGRARTCARRACTCGRRGRSSDIRNLRPRRGLCAHGPR